MAKKKKQGFTPAEDYLAQLEWRRLYGTRRNHLWANNEPRWKYRIIQPKYGTKSVIPGIIFIGFMIIVVAGLLYLSIFLHSGLALYITVVLLIIFVIVFFAARDTEKDRDNDLDGEEDK
jgi:hypothetical protein